MQRQRIHHFVIGAVAAALLGGIAVLCFKTPAPVVIMHQAEPLADDLTFETIELYVTYNKECDQAKVTAQSASTPLSATVITCNHVQCTLKPGSANPHWISAEKAVVDHVGNTLHLWENVHGLWQGYELKTEEALFAFKEQQVTLSQPFTLTGKKLSINAEQGSFDIKEETIELINHVTVFENS